MIIVDTTVWIDYLGGFDIPQAAWLDHQLNTQRFGITDIILCEVLQGIRDAHLFDRTRKELLNFEVFPTGGSDMAIAAAQNFRLLRSKGITVRKTIDCWIATFCLLHGHALLHRDRDYDPFEALLGLHVIHP